MITLGWTWSAWTGSALAVQVARGTYGDKLAPRPVGRSLYPLLDAAWSRVRASAADPS